MTLDDSPRSTPRDEARGRDQALMRGSLEKTASEPVVVGVLTPREHLREIDAIGRREGPLGYGRRGGSRGRVGGVFARETRGPRVVERAAVHAGGERDVLGAFESSLNLETRHTRLHKRRDHLHRHEILRGEEILDVAHVADLAVDDEAVGKAAHACAHWPRLADRPPHASLEKHWPE